MFVDGLHCWVLDDEWKGTTSVFRHVPLQMTREKLPNGNLLTLPFFRLHVQVGNDVEEACDLVTELARQLWLVRDETGHVVLLFDLMRTHDHVERKVPGAANPLAELFAVLAPPANVVHVHVV